MLLSSYTKLVEFYGIYLVKSGRRDEEAEDIYQKATRNINTVIREMLKLNGNDEKSPLLIYPFLAKGILELYVPEYNKHHL